MSSVFSFLFSFRLAAWERTGSFDCSGSESLESLSFEESVSEVAADRRFLETGSGDRERDDDALEDDALEDDEDAIGKEECQSIFPRTLGANRMVSPTPSQC